MALTELRQRFLGQPRKAKPAARHRAKARLRVQALENRVVPAIFNATTVAALITDIGLANHNGATANTINLTGTGPYLLTGVNNMTDGPNGLPVIDSTVASTLTINGKGNTIERSQTSAPFRFFDIASGSHGSLILKDVDLYLGFEPGSGSAAEGGAIFNNGTLNIDGGVRLFDNHVAGTGVTSGGAGNSAAGGGIYCTAGSTLKLVSSNIFENCEADGADIRGGAVGGSAFGGAIYANTTTATSLSSTATDTIQSNFARGGYYDNGVSDSAGFNFNNGAGGAGGTAGGGGLFVAGGTVTVTSCVIESNEAVGGNGGNIFRLFGGSVT